MSRGIVNQEANANFLVRRERDFRRFSMTSVRSPVSMALELATARRMLARETDTLPELFLRTMGRLRNEMTDEIITLARHTVLSAISCVFYSSMAFEWVSGKSSQVIVTIMPLFRVQFAESEPLEAEIKQNLGGLGYGI